MVVHWEVVGGTDKGGILVRGGSSTGSEQFPERLATGALVQELELIGERLNYKKVSGEGPASGWVSIKFKDKALLVVAAPPSAAEAPGYSGAVMASAAVPASAGGATSSTVPVWPVRETDYYVTLGVVFKKPGEDPETKKIISLNRKVGHVVHTTGELWHGSGGGIWVKLDTSGGDSGAGEKPGYVMVDAPGFGTPGPCLQRAEPGGVPPRLLRATAPPGAVPWDGKEPMVRDFLVLEKTTIGDIKVILSMLFGLKGSVSVYRPGGEHGLLVDNITVKEAGFDGSSEVRFEATAPKQFVLVVMNPVQEGAKLCDLQLTEDATVGQTKALLAKITGLKPGSVIMVRGMMGQHVKEDANLDDRQRVVDYGYQSGDEIGFIYTGDLEADLASFLS